MKPNATDAAQLATIPSSQAISLPRCALPGEGRRIPSFDI